MAAILWPLLAFHAAWAEDAPARAVLQLYVDEVDKGSILALIKGREILLSVPDLEKAGVTTVKGAKETVDGTDFVVLSSLAPGVTYRYDEAQLVLRLTIDPNLLETTTVDLLRTEPKGLVYSEATSGFVNYALTSQNFADPTFFSEQGLSIDGKLLDNTATVANGHVTRGNTSLSIDDRSDMTRLTLGDAFANGGIVGGGSYIGGVTLTKNFAINPYFIPYPMQHLAGTVNAPATADVYVNGLLVRSIPLQPGRFDLQNIPVGAGSGNTRVVIRNVFGQQQEIQAPFYLSPGVLKEGLSQYTFSLGFERDSSTRSPLGRYPRPAALAHYRFGWSDSLTPGALLEKDGTTLTAGPEATINLPVGQLGVFGAVSRAGGDRGWAAAVQYSYQSPRFQIGGDFMAESTRFSALGLRPSDDRTIRSYDVFYGMPIGPLDLSAQYSWLRDRDTGPGRSMSLTASTRLGDRFQLFASLSQTSHALTGIDNAIFVGLSVALQKDVSASVSAQRSTHGSYLETAQVQKALPLDTGVGYLVQGQAGPSALQQANLQYQGPYGLYEIDTRESQGQANEQINVSGGLAVIGGRIMPTRAIQDAYALVRVPGVKGVKGYLSNQEVGATDADGDLLIPNLQSYLGNRISINDLDVPIDYSIDSAEAFIAPPYHGGAVVAFPVRRLKAYEGTLSVTENGKSAVPAYGEIDLDVDGHAVSSPIGSDGAFYFENVAAGSYPATITTSKGDRCDFTFTVPKTEERIVRMGVVTCAEN